MNCRRFLGETAAVGGSVFLAASWTRLAQAEFGGNPIDPFEQNKRLGRGLNILAQDPLWRSRDMASRLRYIGFVAREAEKRGWSWACWLFEGDAVVINGKPERLVESILQTLIPARQ